MVGYAPGHSSRRSDSRLAASASANIHVSGLEPLGSSREDISTQKSICSRTGASRCVAKSWSETVLVISRNRYYVGEIPHLTDFIRNRKRGYILGNSFSFPKASNPIPEVEPPEDDTPADTTGSTANTPSTGTETPPASTETPRTHSTSTPAPKAQEKALTPRAALDAYLKYLHSLSQ